MNKSYEQISADLHHIYAMSVYSKVSHSELCTRLSEYVNKLCERTKSGRLKHSVLEQGAAKGIKAMLIQLAWREVEFVYKTDKGIVCGTRRDSDYPYWQEVVSSPSELVECCHVYKGTLATFTDWLPVIHK